MRMKLVWEWAPLNSPFEPPKKIPSREGWRPKTAGVGPFPTPQPTPGPGGPFPSQEGIPLRLSNLHHTLR